MKKNTNYGKPHSAEFRRKMSEAHKSKKFVSSDSIVSDYRLSLADICCMKIRHAMKYQDSIILVYHKGIIYRLKEMV